MNTYLLTWNPLKFPWDEIYDDIDEIEKKSYLFGTWSFGNRNNIKKDDRFFMIKLGMEPRGIFASGVVTSSKVFEEFSYAYNGKRSYYGKIKFEVLIDPYKDIFPCELLFKNSKLKKYKNWYAQASGCLIPTDIANELSKQWNKFLEKRNLKSSDNIERNDVNNPPERIEVSILRLIRDSIRAKRLKEIYEYKCQICNSDIRLQNQSYIEVHHIRPLGNGHNGLDVESNMIVVCPNHHAMFDLGFIKFVDRNKVIINNKTIKIKNRHMIDKNNIDYYNANICQI